MIVRIAYFEESPRHAATHRAFREWMSDQPGFVRGTHGQSPETGEAISITFWESPQALLKMRAKTPPAGAKGLQPDRLEIFHVDAEF